MNPIIILTGPVHSGKTTLLKQWTASQKNAAGILTPVINDERFFYDIQTGESFPMNAAPDEKEILQVGRFNFSKTNFEKAANIIIRSCDKKEFDHIVVDEIGPLELVQQKGFYDVLIFLLQHLKKEQHLVLTVRDNCIAVIQDLLNSLQLKSRVYTKEEIAVAFPAHWS